MVLLTSVCKTQDRMWFIFSVYEKLLGGLVLSGISESLLKKAGLPNNVPPYKEGRIT